MIRSLVLFTCAMTLCAPVSAAAPAYAPFFPDGEYSGSGWSECASIQWFVDAHGLNEDTITRETLRLQDAFDQWSQASGLQFTYAATPPVDSVDTIMVRFIPESVDSFLTPNVVGYGGPVWVDPLSRRILSGVMVIKSELVTSNSDPDLVSSVYLHELGHVLGLGHVDDAQQVMYPYVFDRVSLGDGDRAGGAAVTHPCPV